MIVSPATMSVLGLYNYDNTLFANMVYPSGFNAGDKTTFVNNLLMELAELEVLYTDPSFMKFAIENWSKKELYTWNRVYAASEAEYNPIENYDRIENSSDVTDGSRVHSGKDTTQLSGTDTSTNSGSNTVTNSGSDATTKQTAAFNSTSLVDSGRDSTAYGHATNTISSDSVSVTHGQKEELTHGESISEDVEVTHESRIHGNIGVTTSQQMLEQEMLIAPKLNVINYMIDSFKNRFCILVY